MIATVPPVFVIAEAGVNHNGDLALALRLCDAARQAGADAVKFQTFRAEDLVVPGAPTAQYQARETGEVDQFVMLQRLELSLQQHQLIKAHCDSIGIEFFATPFSVDAVDLLVGLGVKRLKLSSGELTHRALVEHAAATKLPLLMSTGMATMEEIIEAVGWVRAARGHLDAVVVLHCTSAYPAPDEALNLSAMRQMAEKLGVAIGYSDHSLGIEAPLAAVALGATVIEKHLTLDCAMPGPDHSASLEPDDFARMVHGIRRVSAMLGDGVKAPRADELDTGGATQRRDDPGHCCRHGADRRDAGLPAPGDRHCPARTAGAGGAARAPGDGSGRRSAVGSHRDGPPLMPSPSAHRRKLVYLSGTRADFGLMKSTLQRLALEFDLGVAVTGMHLDARYGHTVDEIRGAGFEVCGEIAVDVGSRTPQSMAAGVGECLKGVTDLLVRERPDMLLLLGDRGEMLAGAIAALHLGIVCVHVHGGERSGTVDEPVRHAISKLSGYHLVATRESRERLIRMGEAPQRIFVTGAPGLDGLEADAAMDAQECRARLGLPKEGAFALAVFHPVVQQAGDAYAQTAAMLQALSDVNLPVLWLEPNADAGSLEVLRALDALALPSGSRRVKHLARPVFCAAMRHCTVMVGNSSAGIIEAASFGTPVVNVGDRQRLRERNANVTDVGNGAVTIAAALQVAIAHGRWACDNRYGDGRAGERIATLLPSLPLDASVLEKTNTY